MPIFETPEPISVQIDLPVGDAWIKASDRTDTVVEVRPRNGQSKTDVAAAEQTQVEYANGRLLIKAPRSWRRYTPFGSNTSVDVIIEVPSGSSLRAEASWTTFRSEGLLGETRINTAGDVRLDRTGPLEVDTSYGDFSVEHVDGPVRITTGYGSVRLRAVDGSVVLKNSAGECWIGEVTGEVRVNTASGGIVIDRSLGSV